jgi:hypothetical protein
MSDDRAVESTASQQTVPPTAERPPTQRWTERLWGLKAVIAVALASLVIGGLGGAAVAGLGDHHGDNRTGPGFGHQFRGGPGQGRGPRGFVPPGQLKREDRGHRPGPGPDDRGGRGDDGNS